MRAATAPHPARNLAVPALSAVLALAVLAAPAAAEGRAEGPPAAPGAAADRTGELLAAAREGDLAAVRRLLDAGVPVDAADRYGTTALLAAAGRGHLELVRELLARGADPDHRESFYGTSALATALFSGHRETARALLAAGADDRTDALGFALEEQDAELARAAVEAGPIDASRLEAMRARAADLPPAFQEILAAARSRPDPPPPAYSAADLAPFAGVFEGWESDARVAVEVAGGGLALTPAGIGKRRDEKRRGAAAYDVAGSASISSGKRYSSPAVPKLTRIN